MPKSRFEDPSRRLRIGYLSGDFRDHAVAFFIEPLLASRDRAAFEVFCLVMDAISWILLDTSSKELACSAAP